MQVRCLTRYTCGVAIDKEGTELLSTVPEGQQEKLDKVLPSQVNSAKAQDEFDVFV